MKINIDEKILHYDVGNLSEEAAKEALREIQRKCWSDTEDTIKEPEIVLNPEKTLQSYMAIQDLRGIWEDKAKSIRRLGKNINNYGRCWAAANAYEICAKELGALFSIIETLQCDSDKSNN